MKFNLKNLLLISVLLISLNFLVTAPSAAFSSDSFAQDAFDSFTWRLTTCPEMLFSRFSEGDLMKVGVVAAISEEYGGSLYDTLYLFYYNQSAGS
jgi:hypothetical protein